MHSLIESISDQWWLRRLLEELNAELLDIITKKENEATIAAKAARVYLDAGNFASAKGIVGMYCKAPQLSGLYSKIQKYERR